VGENQSLSAQSIRPGRAKLSNEGWARSGPVAWSGQEDTHRRRAVKGGSAEVHLQADVGAAAIGADLDQVAELVGDPQAAAAPLLRLRAHPAGQRFLYPAGVADLGDQRPGLAPDPRGASAASTPTMARRAATVVASKPNSAASSGAAGRAPAKGSGSPSSQPGLAAAVPAVPATSGWMIRAGLRPNSSMLANSTSAQLAPSCRATPRPSRARARRAPSRRPPDPRSGRGRWTRGNARCPRRKRLRGGRSASRSARHSLKRVWGPGFRRWTDHRVDADLQCGARGPGPIS
jgi:hypothetical protein